MAIHPLWTDDYWLLIMQLYQKSPAGVKSEYSRSVVELALELHIPPKTLQEQMEALKERTTSSLQRLWETYADNPRRLSRDVKRLRQMTGFGAGSTFYNGMDLTQPFEHDYLPVAPTGGLGFLLAIVLFASIRERLVFADYPKCWDGFPIALITAGLMALAFMGFSGLKVW